MDSKAFKAWVSQAFEGLRVGSRCWVVKDCSARSIGTGWWVTVQRDTRTIEIAASCPGFHTIRWATVLDDTLHGVLQDLIKALEVEDETRG